MSPRTPAQLRSDDAVELSDLLRTSGACQVEVSRLTGVSSSVVQRWYDRLERHLPHVHDLRRMPTEVARRILDWCAEPHGLAVVERIPAASKLDHIGHLHRILKESADVSIALSGALADGVVTPAESQRVESELRESIAAQTATLEALIAERESRWPRVVRGGAS